MSAKRGLRSLVKRDLARQSDADFAAKKLQTVVSAWKCENGWIMRINHGTGAVRERVYLYPNDANALIHDIADRLDIDLYESDGERVEIGGEAK